MINTHYGYFITRSIIFTIFSVLSSITAIILHRRFIQHVQQKRSKREHKIKATTKRNHILYVYIQFISLFFFVLSVNSFFIFSIAFNKGSSIFYVFVMIMFTTVAASLITNIVWDNFSQLSSIREMTYDDDAFFKERTASPVSPVRTYYSGLAVRTAVKSNKKFFITVALILNVVSLIAATFMFGTCSCYYPDHFSTSVTRYFYDDIICGK
jgi:heme exporter protein D